MFCVRGLLLLVFLIAYWDREPFQCSNILTHSSPHPSIPSHRWFPLCPQAGSGRDIPLQAHLAGPDP